MSDKMGIWRRILQKKNQKEKLKDVRELMKMVKILRRKKRSEELLIRIEKSSNEKINIRNNRASIRREGSGGIQSSQSTS